MKKNKEPKSFLLESIFLLCLCCLCILEQPWQGLLYGSQTGRTPWCGPWGLPSCCLISGIFSIRFVASVLHGDCECWGNWGADPLIHLSAVSIGEWGAGSVTMGSCITHRRPAAHRDLVFWGRWETALLPLCFTALFILMLDTCWSCLDVEGQYTRL